MPSSWYIAREKVFRKEIRDNGTILFIFPRDFRGVQGAGAIICNKGWEAEGEKWPPEFRCGSCDETCVPRCRRISNAGTSICGKSKLRNGNENARMSAA
jgi:hypothetical protein